LVSGLSALLVYLTVLPVCNRDCELANEGGGGRMARLLVFLFDARRVMGDFPGPCALGCGSTFFGLAQIYGRIPGCGLAVDLGLRWLQSMLGLRLCLGRRRKQNGRFPALQDDAQSPDQARRRNSPCQQDTRHSAESGGWRGLVRRSMQRRQMEKEKTKVAHQGWAALIFNLLPKAVKTKLKIQGIKSMPRREVGDYTAMTNRAPVTRCTYYTRP
ncbi:hypothetical protein MAPG_03990, partial [Magnaporthiopsis poae ATCC 64411]